MDCWIQACSHFQFLHYNNNNNNNNNNAGSPGSKFFKSLFWVALLIKTPSQPHCQHWKYITFYFLVFCLWLATLLWNLDSNFSSVFFLLPSFVWWVVRPEKEDHSDDHLDIRDGNKDEDEDGNEEEDGSTEREWGANQIHEALDNDAITTGWVRHHPCWRSTMQNVAGQEYVVLCVLCCSLLSFLVIVYR